VKLATVLISIFLYAICAVGGDDDNGNDKANEESNCANTVSGPRFEGGETYPFLPAVFDFTGLVAKVRVVSRPVYNQRGLGFFPVIPASDITYYGTITSQSMRHLTIVTLERAELTFGADRRQRIEITPIKGTAPTVFAPKGKPLVFAKKEFVLSKYKEDLVGKAVRAIRFSKPLYNRRGMGLFPVVPEKPITWIEGIVLECGDDYLRMYTISGIEEIRAVAGGRLKIQLEKPE
jgi:hypothetical protein